MAKNDTQTHTSLEVYCIGVKLRTLRTARRLTLARLAAETGLSTALLSKLETDRMVPTLGTLAQICRVYGVGLSYFFREPEMHTLCISRKAMLLDGRRGTETARVTPLNVDTGQAKLVATLIELPAGASISTATNLKKSSGFLYLLEGKLHLDAGGMRETLDAGDCAFAESEMLLSWMAGKQRCRVLAVVPGSGEAEA